MKWNTTPPPKDGTTFLGCWGYPWPYVMTYNPFGDDYSIATLQAQEVFVSSMKNAPVEMEVWETEVWFENESCDEKEITAWMPMPEVGE